MPKNFIKRATAVIKKVYNTPTIPDHIIKFQNLPLIRVLRVLGGISYIFFIGKFINYIPNVNIRFIVMCICIFFIILFIIYSTYITYHRIIHIYNLINSDKLNIHN